jgi:hypothetical protein
VVLSDIGDTGTRRLSVCGGDCQREKKIGTVEDRDQARLREGPVKDAVCIAAVSRRRCACRSRKAGGASGSDTTASAGARTSPSVDSIAFLLSPGGLMLKEFTAPCDNRAELVRQLKDEQVYARYAVIGSKLRRRDRVRSCRITAVSPGVPTPCRFVQGPRSRR